MSLYCPAVSSKESIENQITAIRISKNEVKTDELDIETSLAYAGKFLKNVARQWRDMDVDQQQRLQRYVFPNGIIYDKAKENYGTAEMSLIFELNKHYHGNASYLVAGA